jgi:hypothetical protein
MNGFTWLTGEWLTGLAAAVALALIGGILLGWLDYWVERMSGHQGGDDWTGEGNTRPRGRR